MRKIVRPLTLHRETLHRLEIVGPTKLARLRGGLWETDYSCWWLTEDARACLQTETTSD